MEELTNSDINNSKDLYNKERLYKDSEENSKEIEKIKKVLKNLNLDLDKKEMDLKNNIDEKDYTIEELNKRLLKQDKIINDINEIIKEKDVIIKDLNDKYNDLKTKSFKEQEILFSILNHTLKISPNLADNDILIFDSLSNLLFNYLSELNSNDLKGKEIIFSILSQILVKKPNFANLLIKFDSLPKIIVDYIFKYKIEKNLIDICAIKTLSYVFNVDRDYYLIREWLTQIILDNLIFIDEIIILENLARIIIANLSDIIGLNFCNYRNNNSIKLLGKIILGLLKSETDYLEIKKIFSVIDRLLLKTSNIFDDDDFSTFIHILNENLERFKNDEKVLNNITNIFDYDHLEYLFDNHLKDIYFNEIDKDTVENIKKIFEKK